ncbi:AbrB/MazE/SpoVT family DNA-binding domain-containing protein [Sulfuritalea sp.]|uniref:AbrB/MazE/SpoVT family DNA-binding domain-containing protein n=1 Tax=Sulfuritalea sp. TaxID=2480090 RepID=UPI00286DA667|nr:AbrB/MazE/SpoVT family DNA-binding domain-containing protein [Sulfuritalea sp.]
MKSTLTSRGQTVVPAKIRRQFGLTPADGLEWLVEGTTIRVVPVRRDTVAAFRGQGKGGAVKRLLAERKVDRARE